MEKVLKNNSNKIIFDNIIFSLQTSGGISGVWKELITRINEMNDFECSYLEYSNSLKNINRNKILISENNLLRTGSSPVFLQRFINPLVTSNEKFIFHSSYYRTCRNSNAVNITTVHDFIHEKFRSGLALYINHLQKKRALKNSKAIICISENTKNDLLKYFPNIDKKKIFIVHNGVDSSVFKKLTIPKPTLINNLGKYVLYVGNREQKYKNFISIIDALKFHPELNLVLVGGGAPSVKEYESLNKKLIGRIKYLENIDNQDLNILYNFAFALVYPSIYEGFGMPIIEAQSAGCPVIATNCSSISEIAQNTAILTDNGSSTEISNSLELLKNDNIRNIYVSKGFSNSERFSWDKMAKQIAEIYSTILNKI